MEIQTMLHREHILFDNSPFSVMHEGQGHLTSGFFLLLVEGQIEGQVGCRVHLFNMTSIIIPAATTASTRSTR